MNGKGNHRGKYGSDVKKERRLGWIDEQKQRAKGREKKKKEVEGVMDPLLIYKWKGKLREEREGRYGNEQRNSGLQIEG